MIRMREIILSLVIILFIGSLFHMFLSFNMKFTIAIFSIFLLLVVFEFLSALDRIAEAIKQKNKE